MQQEAIEVGMVTLNLAVCPEASPIHRLCSSRSDGKEYFREGMVHHPCLAAQVLILKPGYCNVYQEGGLYIVPPPATALMLPISSTRGKEPHGIALWDEILEAL